MRRTTHSIGDREGSQEPASSTVFGWRKLGKHSNHKEAEQRVAEALISEFGIYVTHAGDRTQSHDIEVSGISWRRSRYDQGGLSPGLYEVKSLWRKNERCKFDRRFKVGTRGETIYGRRDSQIKSFALSLERELDLIMDSNVRDGVKLGSGSENQRFVEQSHGFIDQALMRKHSKSFEERLRRLAKSSVQIPSLTVPADAILQGGIGSEDILRGFSDIEGIFVVAGPIYTLVTKAEMPNLLTFDSASSEGPKIRLHGDIPSEHRSKVIPLETNKARKGKKSK